jgi:hypothetical protein
MADKITPALLAKELDVDAKRIRAYLRKEFTRPVEAKNSTWSLNSKEADAIRTKFTAKA